MTLTAFNNNYRQKTYYRRQAKQQAKYDIIKSQEQYSIVAHVQKKREILKYLLSVFTIDINCRAIDS